MMDLSWLNEIHVYGNVAAGVLFLVLVLYFLRNYFCGPKCPCNKRLHDKVVIITGANTGLGKETAVDLAKRGATVIIACRDENKGVKALCDIRERSKNPNVFLKLLDLASLKSVKKFAESFLSEYKHLDILINNAAVGMCPFTKTEDGFEMQFGTNHLGHFVLTNLLLICLKESSPSRIVNLTSRAHIFTRGMNFDDLHSKKSYSKFGAYGHSKLANILFTKELDLKLRNTGVTSYAVHPGTISTELSRHSKFFQCWKYLGFGLMFKPLEYGIQTSIYCAIQENIEHNSGMYFADCSVTSSSKSSCDAGAAKKLWEVSEQLTGVKYPF